MFPGGSSGGPSASLALCTTSRRGIGPVVIRPASHESGIGAAVYTGAGMGAAAVRDLVELGAGVHVFDLKEGGFTAGMLTGRLDSSVPSGETPAG